MRLGLLLSLSLIYSSVAADLNFIAGSGVTINATNKGNGNADLEFSMTPGVGAGDVTTSQLLTVSNLLWAVNFATSNYFAGLPSGGGEVSTAQLLVVSNQMITASNALWELNNGTTNSIQLLINSSSNALYAIETTRNAGVSNGVYSAVQSYVNGVTNSSMVRTNDTTWFVRGVAPGSNTTTETNAGVVTVNSTATGSGATNNVPVFDVTNLIVRGTLSGNLTAESLTFTNLNGTVAATNLPIDAGDGVHVATNGARLLISTKAVTNVAHATGITVDASKDVFLDCTNATSGNVIVLLTNCVIGKSGSLRFLADGMARTVAFASGETLTRLSTNATINVTNLDLTASKYGLLCYRVSAGTTAAPSKNVLWWGIVSP